MRQTDLFRTGADLRDAAMAQMEAGNGAAWLKLARDTLADYCRERPDCKVTSDHVHELTPKPSYLHNNIMGAVFRDQRFVPTGEYIPTRRPDGHARRIAVYRLKEGA